MSETACPHSAECVLYIASKEYSASPGAIGTHFTCLLSHLGIILYVSACVNVFFKKCVNFLQIFNSNQLQSTRFRFRTCCRAVLRIENLLHMLRRIHVHPAFKQCTHDDPHHII